MDTIKKHVIAILVENEFGALARIIELFSARGCNIESLNVAPITEDRKLSRVTITTNSTSKTVDLICKLLSRIIPVYEAAELTREEGYFERELALVKIIGDRVKREESVKILDQYRSNVIDITDDAIVFEIIGASAVIDEALSSLRQFGVCEISRTGVAAGFSGSRILENL